MIAAKIWSGGFLATAWTIQFVVIPIHLTAVAAIIMEYSHDLGYIPTVWVVQLCFISFCFLSVPVEISGYFFNFLSPWLYLPLQAFKTAFYIFAIVFAVYTYSLKAPLSEGFWTIWKYAHLALVGLLLITLLSTLGYSAAVVHRYRQVDTKYDKIDAEEQIQPAPVLRDHQVYSIPPHRPPRPSQDLQERWRLDSVYS